MTNPTPKTWHDGDTWNGAAATDLEQRMVAYANTAASSFSPVTWLGTYNAGTTYSQGNAVTYNNATYVSLTNSNVGNQPDTHASSWQPLQGPAGPTGPAGQGPTVVSVSTSTTASLDQFLLVNANSGPITITLPASSSGHVVFVKKTDSSANAVTVAGTIDGVVNAALTNQNEILSLEGDGTAWWRTARPSLASGVVDYPTTTDGRYTQRANNLSDVSSASSARTNLGLGSSATHPVSDFAQTANNLSDLASASTARTNIGAMANPMTTSGDLIVGGSSGTPTRLPAGSKFQSLAVQSSGNVGYVLPKAFLFPSADSTGVTDDANFWAAFGQIYNGGAGGEITLVPNGPFFTVAGWALPQNRPIGTVTATTTSGSPNVTSITSGSTSLSASTTYQVFGPGVPAGATLTTGGSPSSGTLSVNAVAGSGAGTTLYVGDSTIGSGDPICLSAAGIARLCPVAGTAIGLWSHRTATYSTQGNMLAQRWVGYVRDIIVDGQFATGNAIGVHIGDGWGFDIRLRAINFSDVGSGGSGTGGCNPYTSFASPGGIGFYITRTLGTTFWTEKNRIFELSSSNNATAVFVTSAIASGGNGISDEYNVYDINMWCNTGQQGVVVDKVNMGGCRLYFRGNMSRTNALFGTFTGNTTNGSTSVTSITGGTITANLTNGQTTMGSPANGTFNVPNSGTYQVSGTGIPASTTATFVSGVGTLSANATATNTGVTITLMPTTGTAFTLTGAGIPAGATLSMTSATAGTLSIAANATGTGVTLVPSPVNNVAMLSFSNGGRLYNGWLQSKIESGSADAPWTVYCDGNTSGSGSNAGITQSSGHLTTSLFGSNMNGQNFQLNGLIGNGDLPGAQGGAGVGATLWPTTGNFGAVLNPGGQMLNTAGSATPTSNSLWKNLGPPAQVVISGGAYTQVTTNNVAMLNGTSIAVPTSFVVPPGGSLKVTYTSAPTIQISAATATQYSP